MTVTGNRECTTAIAACSMKKVGDMLAGSNLTSPPKTNPKAIQMSTPVTAIRMNIRYPRINVEKPSK